MANSNFSSFTALPKIVEIRDEIITENPEST